MSFMHALYNMNPLATANLHQPGQATAVRDGWDVLPLEFPAMVVTISKVVSDLTLKPPCNITGFMTRLLLINCN